MDSTPVSREGPRVAYSLIWAFGDSKQSTQLNLPDCSPGGWLIQSPSLSFLSHTANSRWLSIVHMVISPKNPEQKIIKRVIALEGDIVKTMGHKNRYVKVPRGHIWVEGDHHGHSFDSNSFGPVSLGLLHAHATHILWPPKRWQKLESVLPPERLPVQSDEDCLQGSP
ncbi:mitochondrial inner membrane protease subunit 2 isoform X19 [Bubalus kerabau]|uniref:mitochondrial inner membrane protease subunit 2 isoform X19 n=1 Tax=Bubalus carabanensis TaxID=3119969 RepID=UPI00244EA27C|nr:mitochondrial inner membrane protease subunit 2 isoform X19 [Bubalus carabanensis]